MNFDQADVGQDNEPNELMLLRVALENLRETAARAGLPVTRLALGAALATLATEAGIENVVVLKRGA